jgi:hypothetical protein
MGERRTAGTQLFESAVHRLITCTSKNPIVFILQNDVPAVLIGFLDVPSVGSQLRTDLPTLSERCSANKLNPKQQLLMEPAVYRGSR